MRNNSHFTTRRGTVSATRRSPIQLNRLPAAPSTPMLPNRFSESPWYLEPFLRSTISIATAATKVDLHGTELMPMSKGTADVASNTGATRMTVRFEKLDQPSRYGPEFLDLRSVGDHAGRPRQEHR